MIFPDRAAAGRRLARELEHLRGRPLVVLGLPRGGVPVAAEVADELGAPLDVIVVRKLGLPMQPELAMGAVGEGGVRVVDHDLLTRARVGEDELDEVERRERGELERRARRFRGERPHAELAGMVAVVVDDGMATGATARAACQVARAQGAARVVLAVPVAPPGWAERLGAVADEYVCVDTPDPFFAVGQFYADFGQTSDEEVLRCLRSAPAPRPAGSASSADLPSPVPDDDPPLVDEEVVVTSGPVRLGGHLVIPESPLGVVVFAHGSGSSRHSPRNRYVAEVLNRAGIGTLLFDLLTPDEEPDRANVFDIELLADRLLDATGWLRSRPEITGLRVGYVGASTGAAAALWAAADPRAEVAAVVSRGGRPDLVGPRLRRVTAPTLLIVGGEDHVVLRLNRDALAELRGEHRMVVVRDATHLFEEPGALRAAAEAARAWFAEHLRA